MNKRGTAFCLLCLALMIGCIPSYGRKKHRIVAEHDSGVYVLSKGDLSLLVSATNGGRIISFKRAGREMLLQDTVHPKYYGATLWASPQRRFWPPSPVLDELPYRVEKNREMLRLISEEDSLTGFRFIKEFSISRDTALIINYSIDNLSDTTQSVAAWDVVRVKGGNTFFAVKDLNLKDLPNTLEHVSEKDGIIRYTYANDSVKRGQKLFATTEGGWLAHQCENLLLIKTFPMVHKDELPLLQGEVEIFLAPNSLYVELENHGRLTELKVGESLSYQQKWYLSLLPSEILNSNDRVEAFVKWRIGR